MQYEFYALPTPTPPPPTCDPSGNGFLPPCPTPTPTPIVTNITFSQVQASTLPISNNPVVSPHNPGIGQRIFPDDDTPMDGVDRRLVRVTATLSQPIPNVLVYFRNFDLDDPATDSIIDPLGNAGDDNNGMPRAGTLSMCMATPDGCWASTNASGVATVEFTVTRQPGDNFAIAAGVIPTEVSAVNMNGIELTNGNGQNIPTTCNTELVCRSQMLTVWRRLHIEVDSMGVSTQNFVLGNSATSLEIRRFETVTLNVNTTNALEENRFENGRMIIEGNSLMVESNSANTVTVFYEGFKPYIWIPSGALFTLYDDDDFNTSDGLIKDGDTGENIDAPDTGFMTANSDDPTANINAPAGNIYAPAYIRPVYDIGDNNSNTLFSRNVNTATGGDIRALFDFDQIATEASTEFWTAYLLGGYQYVLAEDEDPETETPTVGVTDVQNGVGSIVFMETNGPVECTVSPDFCSIADTSAHEIGHLLNADEGDGGIMDGVGHNFSPTSLAKIRRITTELTRAHFG